MLKRNNGFLIHISLSLIIPFFISAIIYVSRFSFAIYKNARFFDILLYLTCCIPMFLSSIIFFLFIKTVPHIIEISGIIIRLLFIVLFVSFHEEYKKIAIIFDVIFIVVNIILGLFLLAIICLQLVAVVQGW